MDKISFSQDIFPWLLGTLTAIAGFLVKSIIDYLWLKAPRMVARATLRESITNPPKDDYRNYEFEIEIELQNHSKNEAYGLQILSLVMPTGLHVIGKISDQYDHVVSDTVSAKLYGRCSITLPVCPENATKTGGQRTKDFGNQVKIKYSYKTN